MRLFIAFCFILPGFIRASELEDAIEYEQSEGQQGIYHGEDLESTQYAAATGDGFSMEEMAAALPEEDEGFKLQDYFMEIFSADKDLWKGLYTLDDEDGLEPYIASVEDYAAFLERMDDFESTKKVAQEQLDKADRKHQKTERKMAEHRLAFAMNLMDGQDAPTEKISYFPRSVLATPDDRLELNSVRAKQMREDSESRVFRGYDVAKLRLNVKLYEFCKPILMTVAKSLASTMKQAIKDGAEEVAQAPCSLPLITDTAELSEGYRIKKEEDLKELGTPIALMQLDGGAKTSMRMQYDEDPMLVRWHLHSEEAGMVYEKMGDGTGLLHVSLPDLGQLDRVGGVYYMRPRIQRVIRDLVFNQILAAFALQHHSIHVDLSPFMALNLDPLSLVDTYDQARRIFSDIQPGQGYEIKNLFLCSQP